MPEIAADDWDVITPGSAPDPVPTQPYHLLSVAVAGNVVLYDRSGAEMPAIYVAAGIQQRITFTGAKTSGTTATGLVGGRLVDSV